jgi:hypothetical protein
VCTKILKLAYNMANMDKNKERSRGKRLERRINHPFIPKMVVVSEGIINVEVLRVGFFVLMNWKDRIKGW